MTSTGIEPVTLGLENRCSIQLSYEIFVTPERFELSTPGLKDRCSNHLSYEILFVISEGFEPSTFGVVNRRSIQSSYEIIFCELSIVNSLCLSIFKIHLRAKFTIDYSHFWVSSGIEPCSPVPQTGALPNKLKKP